jgi:hypothetical protein
MSYTQCPRCGHKALSVATQCPHCGVPFELRHTYDVARPRPRGTLIVLVVAALGAVLLGVDLFRRESGEPAGSQQPPSVSHEPPAVSRQSPAASQQPAAPVESLPGRVDSTGPRGPGEAGGAGKAGGAEAAGPGERRYANIWVNVRRARRPAAAVVKVLRPGEPVLVDSLSQGWYRVVDDGQAVGYVYRGFIDSAPPARP